MIPGRTINYIGLRNPISAHFALQAWTPAQLFSSGEQGVWYEPKPQYLYQDAAGTTPVTADGDPVGYMQDLSGNGNHATQATSAARPIYRTDGTLRWLEFDGVDDILLCPLGGIVTPYLIAYSLDALELTDIVRAFAGGSDISSRIITSINTDGSVFFDSRPNSLSQTSSPGLVSSNSAHSLSFYRNANASGARVDGVDAISSDGVVDGETSNSVDGLWGVGASYYSGSANAYSHLKFSGLVVINGSEYSSKLEKTDQYLANLAGITL